jgi:hypothetical protein
MTKRSPVVCLFLSLLVAAALGCGSSSGGEQWSDDPAGKADNPAFLAWLDDVKEAYLTCDLPGGRCESDLVEDLQELSAEELPGLPQAMLGDIDQIWSGFGGIAHSFKVHGKKVLIVECFNDGGMFAYIFNSRGKIIAGGSAGESSLFDWWDNPGAGTRADAEWVEGVKQALVDCYTAQTCLDLPDAVDELFEEMQAKLDELTAQYEGSGFLPFARELDVGSGEVVPIAISIFHDDAFDTFIYTGGLLVHGSADETNEVVWDETNY